MIIKKKKKKVNKYYFPILGTFFFKDIASVFPLYLREKQAGRIFSALIFKILCGNLFISMDTEIFSGIWEKRIQIPQFQRTSPVTFLKALDNYLFLSSSNFLFYATVSKPSFW